MPGRKPRTNRLLIFLAVLMCVIFGGVFTQSSANPSSMGSMKKPAMFVAENTKEPVITSVPVVADNKTLTDDSDASEPDAPNTPVPTEAPRQTPTPMVSEDPVKASPEAATGVWTSSGSKWMFLTEGAPYTGWLTDIDGNRYYFDKEGIMQTGWLDVGKKRYYLNLDGILQTGDITIGGETYHLKDDGSLKGYAPAAPTPKPEEKSQKKLINPITKTEPVKYAALTFDDGPGAYTDRLLDCLEANNSKATFFMVGTEIENYPDTVKRMMELGHELGNHTYNHRDLSKLTLSDIQSQIGSVDRLLADLTGGGASVVRPPYGSINDDVVASVGTPMILWSIDTLDWETKDVQQTVDTVLNEVEDGSVILMHDIYETTVEAAEILIPKLIEEGYELVTVHQLASLRDKELKPGIAYGAIN